MNEDTKKFIKNIEEKLVHIEKTINLQSNEIDELRYTLKNVYIENYKKKKEIEKYKNEIKKIKKQKI